MTDVSWIKLSFFMFTVSFIILLSSVQEVNGQSYITEDIKNKIEKELTLKDNNVPDTGFILIYSDTAWRGDIAVSDSSYSTEGELFQKIPVLCKTSDYYSFYFYKTNSPGYLLVAVIQDGKLLNLIGTTSEYGSFSFSGKCKQSNRIPDFTVSIQKSEYSQNDIALISGSVKYQISKTIKLEILDPNGDLVQTEFVTIEPDKSYMTLLRLAGGFSKDGLYTIKAQYGFSTDIIEKKFTIKPKNMETQQIPKQSLSTQNTLELKNSASNISFGTITVDRTKYEINYGQNTLVQISGEVISADGGLPVYITMEHPDGTLSESKVRTGSNNQFSTFVNLDSKHPSGIYKISATYKNLKSETIGFELSTEKEKTPPQKPITIPSWVKNTAKWWSDGQITDSDFTDGIEFLIKEGTIKLDKKSVKTTTSTTIPVWIKNNAKWWSEGSIKNEDFVKGIEYLIENGIIKVN